MAHAPAQRGQARVGDRDGGRSAAFENLRIYSGKKIVRRFACIGGIDFAKHQHRRTDIERRNHFIVEDFAVRLETRGPSPFRSTHSPKPDREIDCARFTILNIDLGCSRLGRFGGLIELQGKIDDAIRTGVVTNYRTRVQFVADVCEQAERRQHHQRFANCKRGFARTKHIAAGMHDRHEAITRQRIGRLEMRAHLSVLRRTQRRHPARRAGKIVAQFRAWTFHATAADQITFVFKFEICRILRHQLVQAQARSN